MFSWAIRFQTNPTCNPEVAGLRLVPSALTVAVRLNYESFAAWNKISRIQVIAFVETFFNPLHLMAVKKRWKWAGGIVIAVFALMQLTNLGRTTPPVVPGHDMNSTNPPPPEIAGTLRHACYDCHSYETHWPWYGYVAPVSWWLDSHVNDARNALNFSEWPHGDPQKAGKKWSRVSDAVSDGSMPLPSYTRMHKAARLTDAQRQELSDWADKEAQQLKAAK